MFPGEGALVVGGIFLVAMVVLSIAGDVRSKQELIDWAVSRGGRASGLGVCIPTKGGDVRVQRIRHNKVAELNLSVHLAKHLQPMKIDAGSFRPDCSPAFRRVALDTDLCESIARLKHRTLGVRRPNRKERAAGVVGSYVYLALFGPVTPEQRNAAFEIMARLAPLL